MADTKPTPPAPAPAPAATPPTPPAPPPNPALRMLGLPNLPRKLPSRRWLVFWGVSASLAAAIVYDRREKKRATARWAAAVAPLAREPLASASALPRRVTVYLEAPPGDGLRSAQEHFKEYIKPVLASSGLDWEFVVGRRQGDVRAVVAERVRRARRAGGAGGGEAAPPTDEDVVETLRRRNGIREYAGVKGDIVVGRHTWKEYVRGLHEGWLGPLEAKAVEEKETKTETRTEKAEETDTAAKPKRPPQPPPYNTVDDYAASALPAGIPAELGPSVPVPFPHLLGFLNTPVRLYRFLQRRRTADAIGREVAAVCFAAATRAYDADAGELAAVLAHEEADWPKTVWADDARDLEDDPELATREKPWRSAVVVDARIGSRMRRFVLAPEHEAAARAVRVPEAAVEGWTKGKLRQLGRWAARRWRGDARQVNVGSLDDA